MKNRVLLLVNEIFEEKFNGDDVYSFFKLNEHNSIISVDSDGKIIANKRRFFYRSFQPVIDDYDSFDVYVLEDGSMIRFKYIGMQETYIIDLNRKDEELVRYEIEKLFKIFMINIKLKGDKSWHDSRIEISSTLKV